jgi:protein TonB
MDDFGRELLNAIENAALLQPPPANPARRRRKKPRGGSLLAMAFSARGKTHPDALADINITPLVDVVLVLLLIFMLTAPVLQSGVEVAVPQTRTVNQLTEEHMVVTIDKDQNVFLQDKPVNIHDLTGCSPPTDQGRRRHLRPRRPEGTLRRLRLRHGRRQAGRHHQHQHRHAAAPCTSLLAAAIVAFALLGHTSQHWGEHSSTETGAIQASMVSAIPLPQKAPPVDKSVLASEDVSKAPRRHPRRPRSLRRGPRTCSSRPRPPKAIVKPTTITPPKHPQPTPDSRKATSGDAATQLPQSIAQVTHGTATLTVQNRTFGDRYAYYLEIVGRTVSQNWFTQEIDPRTPVGRSVTITFDIQRDGTPTNVRIQTPSGVQSLDASALHACSAWTASARCPPATRSPSPTHLSTTAESLLTRPGTLQQPGMRLPSQENGCFR